ncbi:MAG: hypothetical protein N2652_01215 [Kiritimatiellae bacterium]|nr:hypothetical protein [Kiritimatiellia bacterium]
MRTRMLGLLGMALLVGRVTLGSPVISYQGVVTVHGAAYTGTGYFKFALVDGQGVQFWSHDGSPPGAPPAGWVALPVNRGLFQVFLGDTNVPGMTVAIPAPSLHVPPIRLRTWFSTNASSAQLLSPDVVLKVPDWSLLDTGAMLVVDEGGRGDVSGLAAAMRVVADSPWIHTVWVAPGFYELSEPVVMPSNRWVVIRGFDEGSVTIRRAAGPALILRSGRISNLRIEGAPAATDSGGGTNVSVELADCVFAGAGGFTAMVLGETGTVVSASRVRWESGVGDALRVGGGAVLLARESRMEVSGGGGAALRLTGSAVVRLSGSTMQGNSGRAVCVENAAMSGGLEVVNSELRGGVTKSNSLCNTVLRLCTISAAATNGPAVLVGGAPTWNETRLEECVVESIGVPAVSLFAPPHLQARFVVSDSRIRGAQLGAGAAVMEAANANAVWALQVEVQGSEIAETTDAVDVRGVRLSGAELRCVGSVIRGSIGIEASIGSEVALRGVSVDGGSRGLWLRLGAKGSAMHSEMIAGSEESDGVGLLAEAGTEMVLIGSWTEGQGPGASAVGIRCVAEGTSGPTVYVAGGGAMGGRRAVLVEGGVLAAMNATLVTMNGLPVEVRRTAAEPNTQFHACQLMRLSPASTPALLLAGNPAPVPTVVNCYLSAPGAGASIALESALGGQVRLLNSVLSTNMGAGVTIAPATSLGYGNYVP